MSDVSLVDATDHATHDSDADPASGLPREFRGLVYPFGHDVPHAGQMIEVASGVFWMRLVLPMSLNHINLYILDDGDGWAIVDTGMNTDCCRTQWEAMFEGPLAGRPVTRIICTHFHPDHLGLAGWLCERFSVPLWISRTEYLLARSLMLDAQKDVPGDVVTFYRQAGWSEQALDVLKARGWGNFAKAAWPLPIGFHRMKAGDTLAIGSVDWRVIVGTGHAPEHVCLVCDDKQIMISGDQVLPRITSNVSVFPTEPMGNPLKDWFDSLDMLRTQSDDLFILPAHNEPFRNLYVRVDQLKQDHSEKLIRLKEFLVEAKTAMECFSVLFRKPVSAGEMGIATGEALAHLRYLEVTGTIKRITDKPQHRFQTL